VPQVHLEHRVHKVTEVCQEPLEYKDPLGPKVLQGHRGALELRAILVQLGPLAQQVVVANLDSKVNRVQVEFKDKRV